MSTTPGVFKAISAVSADIAETGIAKGRSNQQQGYKFRGIDDVYNAMAPILAKHGLVILPSVFERSVVERQTKNGGTLFFTTVGVEFTLAYAGDGSTVTVRTYGEAMDSGDKSTNKAMSAAYKYACMQAFCIPTEGDNDADGTTHEVAAKAPKGYTEWLLDYEAAAEEGTDALKAAWKSSPTAFRVHLDETDRPRQERLKARAAAIDAKGVPA
jgi:hypothetical protein